MDLRYRARCVARYGPKINSTLRGEKWCRKKRQINFEYRPIYTWQSAVSKIGHHYVQDFNFLSHILKPMFRDWFRRIGIRPRGCVFGLPPFHAIAQITLSSASSFFKWDCLLACYMQWDPLSKIPRTFNNSFTFLLPVFVKFWNPNSSSTPKLQCRRSQLLISAETQMQNFSDGGNSTVMPYWMLKLPLCCHFALKCSVSNETRKQLFDFYPFT